MPYANTKNTSKLDFKAGLYSNTIGTGKDLVLLHGWGFSSALFEDLRAKYQHQYRITVIDLPGHGKSAEVPGGLNTWTDAIIEYLPKNPILLGWSLGGLLAIDIASKMKITKLILVASSPNFVQKNDWHFGINASHFKQFSQTLQQNTTQALKRFISLQSHDKTQLKALHRSIDDFPATEKSLNQGLQILLNSNLIESLNTLKIPIEAVLGEHDTLVPVSIHTWYQQNNIKTTVLNTGHLPFLHQDFSLSAYNPDNI